MNYQYIKTDLNIGYSKNDCKKNVFFYWNGKLDLMLGKRIERLFVKIRHLYVISVIVSLHFFLILLKYK